MHRENTNRIRVQSCEGRAIPTTYPHKFDAVVISLQTSLVVYYHLLGADPNVLSLKTEATAPHYRLSMHLYLSRPFKASFLPRVSPRRDFASRSIANTLCILSLFSVACLNPFLYPPRPLRAIRTLHPRGTTHGTHDDAFSFTINTFNIYVATPRSFTDRSSQVDSIKLKHALQILER